MAGAARVLLAPTVPSDIPGLRVWLKPDGGSIQQAGGLISQWTDSSGLGNHFVQATGANKPAYVASSQGGYATFDGVNSYLTCATFGTGSPQTVIAIFQDTGSPTLGSVFSAGPAATGGGAGITSNLTSNVQMWNADGAAAGQTTSPASPLVFNSTHIVGALYQSPTTTSSSSLWVDGGIATNYTGAGVSVTAPTGTASVGWRNDGNAAHRFKGNLLELIVYSGPVTNLQMAQLSTYLSTKYGVALLPSPPIASPLGWWRSDQGISLNAGAVAAWADISGSGNHGTQVTIAKQPGYSLVDAGYNGSPSLGFVAANAQVLALTALFPAQPFTTYIVGESTSGAAQQQFFGDTTNVCIYKASGTGPWSMFAGSTLASADSGFGKRAMCGVFGSGTGHLYINSSTPVANGAIGVNAPTGSEFIGGQTTATNLLNGKIAEILLYGGAHNAAQVAQVLRYLAARYNPGAWS